MTRHAADRMKEVPTEKPKTGEEERKKRREMRRQDGLRTTVKRADGGNSDGDDRTERNKWRQPSRFR